MSSRNAVKRYVRRYLTPADDSVTGGLEFQVVAEIRYDDPDAMKEFSHPDVLAQIVADEANLFDAARSARSPSRSASRSSRTAF